MSAPTLSADRTRPGVEELEELAYELRAKLLHLCGTYEGAVHVGGDLSSADIFTALFQYGMNVDPTDLKNPARDRFLLSKGHAAVAMYITMAIRGFFDYQGIVDTYGQLDSAYGMHPCKVQLPGVEASTGSLGHGLPLAVGMALSARGRGETHRVFCLLGDGETGEGSVWEAAMAARSNELGNLVAFVDRNRQLMTSFSEERVVFEPYLDKWAAFGWNVIETDGHDMASLVAAIDAIPASDSRRPTVVIANTVKGKGVWVKAVTAIAEEKGWDLTMIQGDFDFQKMNPAVESAIGQGADVILDGYTDVASIGSIVTAANDAGIPIFAMDSATEATDAFATNITTDQQGIVDQTVGALDEALGGLEGKNIMVIGHDPHPGIRLRAGLAEEALKAAGAEIAGGEIQKVTSPATGRTEALALVADYIAANPGKLDGVWVGWDDAALGASKAIAEAGEDARVTGVDATSEAIAEIQAGGAFLATIEQPWPSILDTLVQDIEAFRADGTLPTEKFRAVETVLVTTDNAADITPSDQLG